MERLAESHPDAQVVVIGDGLYRKELERQAS